MSTTATGAAHAGPRATARPATYFTTVDSPLGDLLLTGDGSGALASLSVPGQKGGLTPRPEWHRDPAAFRAATEQLAAYFAGELREFDLDLRARGTDFRERVWAALDALPYGTTTSYGELAARIGAPRSAARAIGGAVGANPLLVVRPCHRVVGAGAEALGGYAGGLPRKRQLLTLEGTLPAVA
ncbi:Methylated-DNA--protein-cysteine methyltransferase [Streptomyces sp. YIM 130001]|uniref:methylated-DNA--[protein]-cysteine S-methyltransferase n=1 Tax=Streptomyces sp. YIM 130001 TaxID=2259644 RepID=UPI000E65B19B|nr:methylated-DNA--[protein]-cysteine S-methyltransferase [Streptomyces sp. YIM 130001]RII17617.1 Methylated-DNA--protein-cysteine methyltransferase [Streptomyces sp. YIM 130001]